MMLNFSDAQWSELQRCDARNFVAAVCDQFLAERDDLRDTPGRKGVFGRMQAAHDYALQIGFSSTPHIVRLMYLSADAPDVHRDSLVDAYLRKTGATPEQRLDDMLAVMNRNLAEDR